MGRKETKKSKSWPEFDKYDYYKRSVQAPKSDVSFLEKTYRGLSSLSNPQIFREDFCGTHAMCCEWVKLGDDYFAIGVDLDPEPIQYGQTHYVAKLKSDQSRRLSIVQGNVLHDALPSADLVCAMNFSYMCLKERKQLKEYFANVYKSLNRGGVFVLDCFGGSKCYEANEEETEYEDDGYSYFWDQANFNPINSNAFFHIHFKRKGEPKRRNVFTYDWRLWSLAELRDLLSEVGFKRSVVYWEGTTQDGEGDGNFTPSDVGEECESWIAYIGSCKD
jgi:SAM-dependent methyltransferase